MINFKDQCKCNRGQFIQAASSSSHEHSTIFTASLAIFLCPSLARRSHEGLIFDFTIQSLIPAQCWKRYLPFLAECD